MATADDKLMTMAEVKAVTDTKMDLDYSKLSAHSGDPNSASIFPIRYGNTTYKIDYDALASAIIKQVTPAGINAFGANSVGSVTNANDTSLYGTKLLNGGSCYNLPSSSSGSYFLVTFMGTYQRASTLSGDGVGSVYERYFNTSWYPWVRIDGINAFRENSIGTVTDANDTSLYGTLSLNSSLCSNLPSSSSSDVYFVTFMGTYQRATKFTSDYGVGPVYERFNNGRWCSWVRTDGMSALTSSDIVNNLTTTVPGSLLDASRGAYLKNLIDSLVSSSLFGSYSSQTDAADAIWNAMNAGDIKIGKVNANGSNHLFLAFKNSENYATSLFISYGSTIHLIYKTNGNVNDRSI